MTEMMDISKMTSLQRARYCMDYPWAIAAEPFKVLDHIYFVGNRWVSAFLIATDDGLILIDCSIRETTYLLIDAIHRLGSDPRDIHLLLLSHAHFDHCGAAKMIQEISGCEIYLGAEDATFLTEHRDRLFFEETVPEFRVDHVYTYGEPIGLGGRHIIPRHCPGHTPGTTSFFIPAMCEGKEVMCAMHGGLGTATLKRSYLVDHQLPLDLPKKYCDGIQVMLTEKVDILLPSHVSHAVDYDFLGLARQSDGTGTVFLNTQAWQRMLESKLNQAQEILAVD